MLLQPQNGRVAKHSITGSHTPIVPSRPHPSGNTHSWSAEQSSAERHARVMPLSCDSHAPLNAYWRPGHELLPVNVMPSQPQNVAMSAVQPTMAWQVHTVSHPGGPRHSDPRSQSAFD